MDLNVEKQNSIERASRIYNLSLYRAFSYNVIAAMLEGKNNTFSLPWEIRSIFMQNCFIVSALPHGRRENPL